MDGLLLVVLLIYQIVTFIVLDQIAENFALNLTFYNEMLDLLFCFMLFINMRILIVLILFVYAVCLSLLINLLNIQPEDQQTVSSKQEIFLLVSNLQGFDASNVGYV